MRTQEQIRADLESRYSEIEAEHMRRIQDPSMQRTCKSCRWCEDGGLGKRHLKCREPLVIGFYKHGWTWAYDCNDITVDLAKLCGPEKALWQPKPTLWQRIIEWIEGLFDD